MRLDLAKHGCVHFGVRTELKADPGVTSGIRSMIEETEHRVPRRADDGANSTMVGIYGSRFRAGGLTYSAVANLVLTEAEDESDVTILMVNELADESFPRPPRRVKPVSRLLGASAGFFPTATIECNATFRYPNEDGWSSKINLPIPLVAVGDSDGITHIETAVFSSRNNDGMQYRIAVNKDDDEDTIEHTVIFESGVDWSSGAFRGLLNKAKAISNRLIVRQGEE